MDARGGQLSGYVSLALTSLLFVLAPLPVPKRFESFETAVGLVVLAAAIILGVRGIRIGRGISKAGAWLSLGVLFLWMLATFVVGGLNLVHSVAESRP
jgi:VIT1/CCC1 family predicted Fe2+/Mn2+ transporter